MLELVLEQAINILSLVKYYKDRDLPSWGEDPGR